MEIKSIVSELNSLAYHGRGIIIGKSADGTKAITAYFIMGRSENSRNRIFIEDGEGIRTQAFDESKMTDPHLIIYAPVRVLGNKTIVTNGDQTDTIYELMNQYNLADRVIVASFWPDVSYYIDNHYRGKMNRAANPFEIVDFYGCYTRNDDLSREDFKFVALQMPYYWDDGKLLVANLGQTGFIDYAHKYCISVQYWTVNKEEDAKALAQSGADLLMTDYPDRIRKALYGE